MDANLAVERQIRRVGRRVMRWGRDDCVLWAAAVSRDLTGNDLLVDDRWRTKRQGLDRIGRDGNLYKALLRKFRERGLVRTPADVADLGSFGLVLILADDAELHLAVKVSDIRFVRRVRVGVEFVHADDVKKAWRWAT